MRHSQGQCCGRDVCKGCFPYLALFIWQPCHCVVLLSIFFIPVNKMNLLSELQLPQPSAEISRSHKSQVCTRHQSPELKWNYGETMNEVTSYESYLKILKLPSINSKSLSHGNYSGYQHCCWSYYSSNVRLMSSGEKNVQKYFAFPLMHLV